MSRGDGMSREHDREERKRRHGSTRRRRHKRRSRSTGHSGYQRTSSWFGIKKKWFGKENENLLGGVLIALVAIALACLVLLGPCNSWPWQSPEEPESSERLERVDSEVAQDG